MKLEFKGFPKMPRLLREVIISEKIDGTNASIMISKTTADEKSSESWDSQGIIAIIGDLTIRAGSRNRWITPSDDNFEFATWVNQNRDELINLGVGQHFGEWWGESIQRKYGMKEKRFSLFDTQRWALYGTEPEQIPTADPRTVKMQEVLPECCHLVPVLYKGLFDTYKAEQCLELLRTNGSVAAPGFMKPEGIILFHVAGNLRFKATLEGDEHKGIKQ